MKRSLKAAVSGAAFFAAAIMLAAAMLNAGVRGVFLAQPEAATYEAESAGGGYCLREYNGRIAVFYDGQTENPAVETTIEVGGLRAVDRDKLSKGIEAKTYEDVLKLLEDFGS